jgi:hypothetical protein
MMTQYIQRPTRSRSHSGPSAGSVRTINGAGDGGRKGSPIVLSSYLPSLPGRLLGIRDSTLGSRSLLVRAWQGRILAGVVCERRNPTGPCFLISLPAFLNTSEGTVCPLHTLVVGIGHKNSKGAPPFPFPGWRKINASRLECLILTPRWWSTEISNCCRTRGKSGPRLLRVAAQYQRVVVQSLSSNISEGWLITFKTIRTTKPVCFPRITVSRSSSCPIQDVYDHYLLHTLCPAGRGCAKRSGCTPKPPGYWRFSPWFRVPLRNCRSQGGCFQYRV